MLVLIMTFLSFSGEPLIVHWASHWAWKAQGIDTLVAEFQLWQTFWWLDLISPNTFHVVLHRSKSTNLASLWGLRPFYRPCQAHKHLLLLGFTSSTFWWPPSCHVFSPIASSCYSLNSYESHRWEADTGRIYLLLLNYRLGWIDELVRPHTECPSYSWASIERHWQ